MDRELSLWKAELAEGVTPEDGLKAIEGLRVLADSGQVDWLERGAKLTARALFHSRNGAVRMYPQAVDAYYAQDAKRSRARGNTEKVRRGFLQAAALDRKQRSQPSAGSKPALLGELVPEVTPEKPPEAPPPGPLSSSTDYLEWAREAGTS